jgi:GAF domain-containing protein
VLRVISSSQGELEPVFQAMLEHATRICGAKFSILFRYEGGLFHPAASLDVPPAYANFLRRQAPFAPEPGQIWGRLCQSKTVIHVVDRATEPDPGPSVRYAGARSSIAVPMLKENELVGAFFIYRTEVRPFTDKQIALVQNFAAQAVIAIENTRLLNELRQRTTDLSESLQQQTATADVLRVIASSPGDLQPVFQNLLGNATRLCMADFGLMFSHDGEAFHLMAHRDADRAYVEYLERGPLRSGAGTLSGQLAASNAPVHVGDYAKSEAYLQRDPLTVIAVERGGVRTVLGVPMLRDRELIGAMGFTARRFGPSAISRSSWWRISPPRPSSPSRTRGCSTNCASARPTSPSRWSSRLRPAKC